MPVHALTGARREQGPRPGGRGGARLRPPVEVADSARCPGTVEWPYASQLPRRPACSDEPSTRSGAVAVTGLATSNRQSGRRHRAPRPSARRPSDAGALERPRRTCQIRSKDGSSTRLAGQAAAASARAAAAAAARRRGAPQRAAERRRRRAGPRPEHLDRVTAHVARLGPRMRASLAAQPLQPVVCGAWRNSSPTLPQAGRPGSRLPAPGQRSWPRRSSAAGVSPRSAQTTASRRHGVSSGGCGTGVRERGISPAAATPRWSRTAQPRQAGAGRGDPLRRLGARSRDRRTVTLHRGPNRPRVAATRPRACRRRRDCRSRAVRQGS